MFIDKVVVEIRAGKGGDGAMSFRHEKFIERGGPDGGDGGNGGDVVFVADEQLNTLVNFRFKQELKAGDGGSGDKRKRHGKNGEDLIVRVPVGTLVRRDGKLIGDLITKDQRLVVARGGDGGFGNAHFISSTRQAPRVAEKGEPGEEFTAELELKLLADVGLVGLPNAGKSTFLSVVTNARPEIADYPFTTLTPHLGMAEIDGQNLLVADIPGLIQGASEGKGLGDEFLKHVERTGVLLHLVDAWSNDVAADYQTIQKELASYSPRLGRRRQIVVLTKIDGLDPEILELQLEALKKITRGKRQILAMSSASHVGLVEVLRALSRELQTKQRSKVRSQQKTVPVIELSESKTAEAWRVVKKSGRFIVTGEKIEKFARRTDFDSQAGLERLRDIMRKTGIIHELERRGIESGDQVFFGNQRQSLTY